MLLADLGYEEAALLYIKSILKCIGASLADVPTSGVTPGPLSLCILSADLDGLLASLGLFEKRLMSRNLMSGGGIPEPDNDNEPTQVPVYDEGDADVSFLTAHSNIHDITHSSQSPVDRKGDQKSKEKLNKENGLASQHLEPQMEDQVSLEPEPVSKVQAAPPIAEQSSTKNGQFMAAKPPVMHQPPMASTQTSSLTQQRPMASNVPSSQHQMPPLMQQPPMAAGMSPTQPEKPSQMQPPMAASTPTKQPEKPPLMQQPPMAVDTPSNRTPSREPQKQPMVTYTPDHNQAKTEKKQVAPMSAPANLEKNAKKAPSSASKSKCNHS
jgi:hypothetical protein